jgi:hypothetical protein
MRKNLAKKATLKNCHPISVEFKSLVDLQRKEVSPNNWPLGGHLGLYSSSVHICSVVSTIRVVAYKVFFVEGGWSPRWLASGSGCDPAAGRRRRRRGRCCGWSRSYESLSTVIYGQSLTKIDNLLAFVGLSLGDGKIHELQLIISSLISRRKIPHKFHDKNFT